MPAPLRVGVVGGGILGAAVARRILEVEPEASVIVLEKEAGPARHQSGRNSGVVHAGVYYAPGSLKATLCRRGIELLREYCAARGLPYRECGKLIVARDAGELGRLEALEGRARANGVPGLLRLDPRGIETVEPHVRGIAALHSPRTAITDFARVSAALLEDVRAAGGTTRFAARVANLRSEGEGEGEVRLRLDGGEELAADRVVVCAGLYADRLARKAGDGVSPVIVPFRGEYRRLIPERSHLVRGLVYPVPDPQLPFLGVHLTRRIDGAVDIGPNAVIALAREGYRRRVVSPGDAWGLVRSPGMAQLVRRYWRAGIRELAGSVSAAAFVARARTYVPELRRGDVRPAPAGVRAQALDPDGSLVDDFRISRRNNAVFVRNAPSPAATSALAIAELLVEQLLA